MNVLADESVERQIVARLRQDGYSVLYVAEMEPGITDNLVLRRANETQSFLITEDKDWLRKVLIGGLISLIPIVGPRGGVGIGITRVAE